MRQDDKDKELGLYQKYVVRRTDGTSESGGKHEHCEYFVLDLDHDPFAAAALEAYAAACKDAYPALAPALLRKANVNRLRHGTRELTPAEEKAAEALGRFQGDYSR